MNPPEILAQDPVPIVPVPEDEVEAGDVRRNLLRQVGVSHEQAFQARMVIHRGYAIRVRVGDGRQRRGVPHYLDLCLRKPAAHRPNRRQCQDQIAETTRAHDENVFNAQASILP